MNKKIREISKLKILVFSNEEDFSIIKSLLLEDYIIYLKKLFNFKKTDILPKIKINIVYSIEEFNFFFYEKHQNWILGFANYQNMTVTIFSQSKIEKFTIHKKERFEITLKHELFHLVYGLVSRYGKRLIYNNFLDEAMAIYFSNGNKKKIVPFNYKKLLNFINKRPNNSSKEIDKYYIYGHFFVKKLIDKYSTEIFFSWLRSAKNNKDLIKNFDFFFKIKLKKFIEEFN